MYDPRWDNPRERDDGRARVYDERDRTDHDPRDGLMHDLDLPRGDARELVINRDYMYELNGEDILRQLGLPTEVPKPRSALAPPGPLDFPDDHSQDAPELRRRLVKARRRPGRGVGAG